MLFFHRIVCLAVVASVWSSAAFAVERRDFDFNSGTFDYNINEGNGITYHRFTAGGLSVDMPHQGLYADPVLSGNALRVQVGRDSSDRARSEFRIIHGETHAEVCPRFGQNFNYGFKFIVDPNSDMPLKAITISQVWQRGKTSFVPFVLQLYKNSDTDKLTLKYVTKYGAAANQRDSKDLGEIVEGNRYRVQVNARPSYPGLSTRGKMKITVIDLETNQTIGYVNRAPRWGTQPSAGGALDRFDVRMGIYRVPQYRGMTLFLDDCWYQK